MGWNPLDPFDHKKKIKKELGRAAKKMGLDDMLAFEKNQLGYWWDEIRKNPLRILAPSPISTKVWNEVTGRDDKALINQLGGPSKGAYVDAMEKGIDIGPSAGSHAVASAIASWYAGGALAAAAPAAVPLTTAQGAAVVGAGAGAVDAELDPIDLGGLEETYAQGVPGTLRVPNVPGFAEGGDVEKAPWPDSTKAEDAAYALATQMIDMEFRGDVVRQGGPQLQGFVDPDRARVLGTTGYNLQGMYRPEGAEGIMEANKYAPLADEMREKGIEEPAPDTVSIVGGSNANEQVWAHEFGHRRDSMEGGGSERYRLIHDAFRSDTPFEWGAALNRWYAYNERRYRKQGDINNYSQVEKDLKEAIASNTDSFIGAEVRARESRNHVPIKREGMFAIESLERDQREQMKRRSNSWSLKKYNTAIDKIQNQGKPPEVR